MAQEDRVARERELAAERQRRRRAKLKIVDGGAADRAPTTEGSATAAPPILRPAGVNSPRVRSTQKLEGLGTTPEAFTGVPPATGAPVELVAPPSADAVMGAKKFAALLGFMVKLALDDATVRYSASIAAMPGGALVGDDPEALKRATVDFVTARAERVALKYGFGLTIPYEDEIVTVGAAAASGAYLARKFTGRLPEPGAARPAAAAAPPPAAGDGPEEEDSRDLFGRINVGDAPAGDIPSWMAR